VYIFPVEKLKPHLKEFFGENLLYLREAFSMETYTSSRRIFLDENFRHQQGDFFVENLRYQEEYLLE
jgi:hypothetical protein